MNTAVTLEAAAIAAAVTLTAQVLTMVQIRRNRIRDGAFADSQRTKDEKFQTDQKARSDENATKLSALEADLNQLGALQTRWDQQRFDLYVEIVDLAKKRFRLIELVENLDRRIRINRENKENGLQGGEEYDRNYAQITLDGGDTWKNETECFEDWNTARSKARILVSNPVWESIEAIGASFTEMKRSGSGAHVAEYGAALEEFVGSARIELGTDHFAGERGPKGIGEVPK